MQYLYEILVPTHLNSGEEIDVSKHQEWDAKVLKMANGLTILKKGRGSWFAPNKELFQETMIPVRIMCEKNIMYEIALMTKGFYSQKAVMYYRISEEVNII